MEIQKNISLKPFNTFGIDVVAKQFVEVTKVDDFKNLIKRGIFKNESFFILGGGSNILFSKDYDGIVVKNSLKGIETYQGENNEVIVKVGGGEKWEDLVYFCVDKGLGGIENLCLIPGTVGAAPIQNIGAYGVEIKDVFYSLEAMDLESGEIKEFNKNQCRFGYRDSIFKQEYKGEYIIISVSLLLEKDAEPNTSYGAIQAELERLGLSAEPSIRSVSDAVASIRRSKLPDPELVGNAGSFFKNPVLRAHKFEIIKAKYPDVPFYQSGAEMFKVPAGWLIEQCGWKGKQIGNAAVHDKQALVIVNLGNATGKEVLDLAAEIQHSVKEKFDIKLEMEVNVI